MQFWIKDRGKIYRISIPRSLKFVYQERKGLSVFSNKVFKKGEKVAPLRGKQTPIRESSPSAVQLNAEYSLDGKRFVFEDFINHSCDPNTCIDFQKREFKAIRDIKKNTEITYNYLTTEYDMKRMQTSFMCRCGSSNCFKRIYGFRYLTKRKQKKLTPFLSPFLKAFL